MDGGVSAAAFAGCTQLASPPTALSGGPPQPVGPVVRSSGLWPAGASPAEV